MTEPFVPLRIGILGAARIAPMALVRPARRVPDVDVLAVAARDPARAGAFAKKHRIARTHRTYGDLLDDPDIDAVYNPLPNSHHAYWTIRALDAGKHVLCEKPLAANADEAERMAEAASRSGRLLVEAFHYRYHPLAARMKALLDQGSVGNVRHVEAHMCIPLLLPGDIRFRYELAGGATMDVGSYTINLIRFLAGARPTVTRARARLAGENVDRFMEAEFAFTGGRTGRITCSLLSRSLLRLVAHVRGDRGELRVINPFLPHLYHRLELRTAEYSRVERLEGEATYVHQLRAFADACRNGRSIPTDTSDGIENMRAIDAVYEAAGLKRRGT